MAQMRFSRGGRRQKRSFTSFCASWSVSMYLEDTHTAFYDNNPVQLRACTYLHNYNYYSDDVIFSSKFHDALRKYLYLLLMMLKN